MRCTCEPTGVIAGTTAVCPGDASPRNGNISTLPDLFFLLFVVPGVITERRGDAEPRKVAHVPFPVAASLRDHLSRGFTTTTAMATTDSDPPPR